MPTATSPHAAAESRAAKHDERREQLALSALETLGELGYAGASLREIAAKSPFSHGVVHYYFSNKTELIVHCVKVYKAQCATRYDSVIAESTDAPSLVAAFADKLVETLVTEVPLHRLWYDLRTASFFEPDLREAVQGIDRNLEAMVGRVAERYAELADAVPVMDQATAYALFDGLFENAVIGLDRSPDAADLLRQRVKTLLPSLFVPAP